MTVQIRIDRTLADATGNLTDAQKERLRKALERSLAKMAHDLCTKPKPPVDTWMNIHPSFIYSPGS